MCDEYYVQNTQCLVEGEEGRVLGQFRTEQKTDARHKSNKIKVSNMMCWCLLCWCLLPQVNIFQLLSYCYEVSSCHADIYYNLRCIRG